MNAYELAEFIETGGENIDRKELTNMLRQQADRIAELEKELDKHFAKGFQDGKIEGWKAHNFYYQTKPLSDEEIENIAGNCCHGATAWHSPELDIYEFARAIEERHGIK